MLPCSTVDGGLLVRDPPDDRIWAPEVVAACERAAQESIAGQRRTLTGRQPAVIAQPLLADGTGVIGVLVVVTTRTPGPGMMGAVGEVARYASSQIELAELDASRARLDRAEVLALRAQISPHFIYNALNTIASFVRTDPDRARELILDFADFTRYSFRAAGQYTTLAEELHNIDRYLRLERARFGASLKIKLQVAPEVLNVVVPFLALQPLVENAVRHGLAGRGGGSIEHRRPRRGLPTARSPSRTTVSAWIPSSCGPGPPMHSPMSGSGNQSAHVGLTNVDHRLRAAFGDDYGLVVETAIGAGTKVRDAGTEVPVGSAGQRRCIGMSEAMTVLAVDDEAPALDELAYMLQQHPAIGRVRSAADATLALRELHDGRRRRGVPRYQHAGAVRFGTRCGAVELRPAARGGVRDRPRRQGGRRLRRRRRRLPAQADPKRPTR